MDLNLFFRVIRRFKFIVILGVIVATSLALLSFARITNDGLAYRQPKQWSSTQQLNVATYVPPRFRMNTETPDPIVVAQAYATLATSNAVATIIRREANGKPPGKLLSSNVPNFDGSASRIFALEGVSTSKAGARAMVKLATRAFYEYVPGYNAENFQPPVKVTLTQLGGPAAPKIIKSPSKTRPVFVFLAVLIAFIGIAFILENLRPAVRVQAPPLDRDDDATREMSAPPLRATDQSH
jgi:hypothetical protein